MKKLKITFATIALIYFVVGLFSCSPESTCPTYSHAKPIYRTNSINPVKPVTYREYVRLGYKKVN